MKLLYSLLFLAISREISAQGLPASFVSTKLQTAYNSKCTTLTGSNSVLPVLTTVTSSVQFPTRTITSINTFTPTENVLTTSTPVAYSVTDTTTSYTYTVPLQRRDTLSKAEGKFIEGIPGVSYKRFYQVEDKVDDTFAVLNKTYDKTYFRFKCSIYPQNVQCAVSAIPGITSFYTSTAASRTVTRTAVTKTIGTNSIISTQTQAPPNPGFKSQTYWVLPGGLGGLYLRNGQTVAGRTFDVAAHSGSYALAFGQSGVEAITSWQNIPGNQGSFYNLSFWLGEYDPDSSAVFRILWNGLEVFSTLVSDPDNFWKNLANVSPGTRMILYRQYNVRLAAQNVDLLQFSARQDPFCFVLDDISLTSL